MMRYRGCIFFFYETSSRRSRLVPSAAAGVLVRFATMEYVPWPGFAADRGSIGPPGERKDS
jgi:hypothetical protein